MFVMQFREGGGFVSDSPPNSSPLFRLMRDAIIVWMVIFLLSVLILELLLELLPEP